MHTCASSNFLFPRTYVYHIILTNFVNWTKTDSVNCEKSFIIKSFNFNALFNTLRMWRNESLKTLTAYLPLVAISSTLLKVLKWSHNFTIHKRLCDHDNNRRVCTIYFSVITEKIPTTKSNSLHPKGIEPESNWRSISKMFL